MNTRPLMLFLSQNAVFDMGHGAGKTVIFKSLEMFLTHFNILLIAPGSDPGLIGCRFFNLPDRLFLKLKSIPVLGYLFNFIQVFLWEIRVRRILKRNNIQPDVIYSSGPWMSIISNRIFKGQLPLINRYYGVNWKPGKQHTVKQKLRFLLKNQGYTKFGDAIIMTNDGTRGDEFLIGLGIPKAKIHFLRNGIDLPNTYIAPEQARQMLNNRYGIPTDSIVLLCVSRLAGWKRVDRSIELLSELRRLGTQANLVIVGDGEKRKTLEEQAIAFGVSDFVVFAGAVPHKELELYYSGASVFCSFYDYSNAGNPLFEAMVRGCLIITLQNDALVQLLPETAALYLANFNAQQAADQLTMILQNKERVAEMKNNAKESAKKAFFSWNDRLLLEVELVQKCMEKND